MNASATGPWWLPALIAVTVPLLLFALGLWGYFVQKQSETRRRRYLENGLEKLAQQFDHALAVYRHNWGHAIFILRQLRSLGARISPDAAVPRFLPLDPATLEISTHHRVDRLLGDKVFYDAHQLLVAFVVSANDFFASDLCAAVRNVANQQPSAQTPKQIADTYFADCVKLDAEANVFYPFLDSLGNLAGLLEGRRFTGRSIAGFKSSGNVKSIVTKCRDEYLPTAKKVADAMTSV